MGSPTQNSSVSPSQKQYIPRQIHLVGSSPYSTNTVFFQRMSRAFPNRLLSLPDGEVGKRSYFVRWQHGIFADNPHILLEFEQIGDYKLHESVSSKVQEIKMSATNYDDFAIESYAEFCKLREQGVIEKGIRFQVSLPTPVNVIGLLLFPEYRKDAESVYEKAFLAALRRIQDEIPAADLAVQFDMAYEIGMLEIPETFTSWFDTPVMQGVVTRAVHLANHIDKDVKMGFHLCYGDAEHKHFVEPKNLGVSVKLINELSVAIERRVDWFHVPVPKDRTDEAYFAPLRYLKLKPSTEIYLGLAHAWDLGGTRQRIGVASKFLKDFGIGTECGFGRTEIDELDNIIGLLAEVTAPDTLLSRL